MNYVNCKSEKFVAFTTTYVEKHSARTLGPMLIG